jgi:N-acetylglucosamine repressor
MIDPGGERCDCGNFGCLETVVSTRALVRYWQDGIRLGWPSALSGRDTAPTASDIVEAARMGDQAAASGIRRVGELLGVACANLGYLFGPEIIVLGGPLAGAGTLVLEPIRTVAASRLEKNLHYAMDITLSHFGSEGPCLGAAVHAIDTLLLQLPRG